MDDLLADFLTETQESLSELDAALLDLERTPGDKDILSKIFRGVHTIKGTCGFLGLPRLERVAHAAENVLGKLRDGVLAANPDIISRVLAALDAMKGIVANLGATGSEPAGDDAALIAALNLLAEGGAPAEANTTAPTAGPGPVIWPDEPAAEAVQAPTEVSPAPAPMPAPVPASVPAPMPPANAAAENATANSANAAAGAAASAAPETQSIRVSIDILEHLMTLVSELVLARNQLLQIGRQQGETPFTAPLQRLSHITSDLQEGVMKTRMQPVGNAWNKLPRLVRDLSRDLNKRIELVMLGADTELDRQVLELIRDPLTHMVRNSGDHGLESPAERRAAGKPETGHITLNAFHEGGHIIMEISDDGRGLAADKIRAKALANGLATEAELAGMTEGQIQAFIFRPGFSTAAAVTAVSGRGVGMDVVKTNIEKIGGTIDLKSTPGIGTTFTVKIPLTLAIVSALIVEAGGERFAIPQISVVELVRVANHADADMSSDVPSDVPATAIEHLNDTPVLRLRDQLLPLVSLNALLRLDPGAAAHAQNQDSSYIVVVSIGNSTLGIIVDRVFDTEEIVVKPVAPILRHITLFSGNTILGDGSVIMILDPTGIARASGIINGDSRAAAARASLATSTERLPMLVFRAGGEEPKAVPLGLVSRIEDIPRDRIEHSGALLVTQYRGRLMPLVPLSEAVASKDTQKVLVFADGERSMGLIVDEIVDVVHDHLNIELSAARPGLLGTAVIGGRATGILDTGHWLTEAWRDWFSNRDQAVKQAGPRILVVEDSQFFRQMIVPPLAAAGYHVTTIETARKALALRDGGAMFDLVISDIEMPEMDGFEFVRHIRGDAGSIWAHLPVVALSGRSAPQDVAMGREAGFTDFVAKLDRDVLLAALKRCLAKATAA